MTVGEFAFVSDPKFSVKHIPFREEWNLIIDRVEPKHSGRYECQVSTKDDLVRYVDLKVISKYESVFAKKKYTPFFLSWRRISHGYEFRSCKS